MEQIALHALEQLPKTNNSSKYLLICMGYFMKWPEIYPIANQGTDTIAKVLLEEFVCRFGAPSTPIRDEVSVRTYLTKRTLYWE